MMCGTGYIGVLLISYLSQQKTSTKESYTMYVLARHEGESIIIADVIEIKVLSVTGKIARLGINAPREVPVKRAELLVEIMDKAKSHED
jgi:carbon storage regulator